MPQLTDDCFASGQPLMTTETALHIIQERIVPITTAREVSIRHCVGHVLAENLISAINVPPHNNAAVDGYAIRSTDLNHTGKSYFEIVTRVTAGRQDAVELNAGEAARIFTGAVMPLMADTVIMQEDAEVTGNQLVVPPSLKKGSNTRYVGEDTSVGDILLKRGHRLKPQDLALAASIGRSFLSVQSPLRVGVFSTGDELREPYESLSPGAIHDANRYMLLALLEKLGAIPSDLGILPDRLEVIQSALKSAAENYDLLLTSGGISSGEEDHVRASVLALGHFHFWRLAIKPGRPLAMGQIDKVPFIGLPGNPVAAMICFVRFARPVIFGLTGAEYKEPQLYDISAGFSLKKKSGRREWVRAKLTCDSRGKTRAIPFGRDGSGIINSLTKTDGLVEIEEEVTRIDKGDIVKFLPFNEVLT